MMKNLLIRYSFIACVCTAAVVGRSESFVLSNEGSGRATAYWEQNKIVSVGDKTHVVWLDAVAEGFRVRGRTLDRTTGQWSKTVTIGEAQDNHGGPGVTVDQSGYLHVAYYPHHEQFRYRKSTRPNDLSKWEPEERFGEGLSFPTLLCAADGTLLLTARRGFFDEQGKYIKTARLEQELWTKPPSGAWQRRSTLIRSRYNGYSQFATALAWGPDGKTLHLSARIYEGNSFTDAKPVNTVAYMVSPDRGLTWLRSDGTPIALPATVETIDVLADDGGLEGPRLNSGPLAVDSSGIPHLLYSASHRGESRIYLATPAPGLGWTRRDLTPYLPPSAAGWGVNVGMGGGLTFDETGRATIVAVVVNPPLEDRVPLKEWGHGTTEIVRLWSDDRFKTVQSELISAVDPRVPHWLPNIERATGHNRVPKNPSIIYTAGRAGAGLHELDLNNQVIWYSE